MKDPFLLEYDQAFFAWICTRRACDNPRGDFIRDTRDMVDMLDKGIVDESRVNYRLLTGCEEAHVEHHRLARQYERETGRSLPRLSSIHTGETA